MTLDLGLAERDDVVLAEGLGRQVKLNTIHQLVLQADDGVGVADGGLEQTLGILG